MKQQQLRALDEISVRKLCSGQVVTDAASAIKELVENSLDAKATRINILVKDFGLSLIEVSDDGCGIEENDFESIALPHWTSKLSEISDLSTLSTLGFRGEALSALCSLCSEIKITTSTLEKTPSATRLSFDKLGKLVSQEIVTRTKGTTVSLMNIFHHLPVRRTEYSKHSQRELSKIVSLLQQYAIGSSNIRFSLIHEKNSSSSTKTTTQQQQREELLRTDGSGLLRGSCSSIFGTEFTRGLLDIPPNQQTKNGNDKIIVKGLISKAENTRASTDRILFFLNSRPVDLPKLAKKSIELFRLLLGQSAAGGGNTRHAFPALILQIESEPNQFDVNVSPDKRTVLFHNETNFIDSIVSVLAKVWEQEPGRRLISHSQTVPNVHSNNNNLMTTLKRRKTTTTTTTTTIVHIPQTTMNCSQQKTLENGQNVIVVTDNRQMMDSTTTTATTTTNDFSVKEIDFSIDGSSLIDSSKALQPFKIAIWGVPETEIMKPKVLQEEEQKEEGKGFTKDDFRKLEVVGQFNLAFIVAKIGKELFIIDQHAADEIRNFEELETTTELHIQPLISPMKLELSTEDELIAINALDDLKRNGFLIEIDNNAPPGSRLKLISCVFSKGATFSVNDVYEMITLLHENDDEIYPKEKEETQIQPEQRGLSRFRAMLAMRACKKSVKVGSPLSLSKMKTILEKLSELKHPWKCPHGRPTIQHLITLF